MIGLCVAAGILSLAMRETAPAALKARPI
jgi:hypothetical protein